MDNNDSNKHKNKSKNTEPLEVLLARMEQSFVHDLETKPAQPLPMLPEDMSAILNSLARSPTFAPLERGQKEILDKEILPTQGDVVIKYSGLRLSESDLDVYLIAIKMYSGVTPGESVEISTKGFLKALNRNGGKSDRIWLKETLQRLGTGVTLEISSSKGLRSYFGPLLVTVVIEEERQHISFSIPQDFLRFFSLEPWSQISLTKRFSLKGSGSQLAKWLHTYLVTHRRPYPMKLETYQKLSGSKIKQVRNYKIQMVKALNLLKDNHLIHEWSINDDNLVYVWRRKEDLQQPFLAFDSTDVE